MSETKTPLIIIPPDTLPMILAADKNNISVSHVASGGK